MVHILVSWYTASKPSFTDCERSSANSWLLKIFKLQPGGILQTCQNKSFLRVLGHVALSIAIVTLMWAKSKLYFRVLV